MFENVKKCRECGNEIFREDVENNFQCGYHGVCIDCLPKKKRKLLISLPCFENFRYRKDVLKESKQEG